MYVQNSLTDIQEYAAIRLYNKKRDVTLDTCMLTLSKSSVVRK